jgi:cathepsin A (carboxypeptidase C)
MKKVLSLLPLAFAIPAILAAPAEDAQVVLGGAGHAQSGLLPLPHAVEGIINKGGESVHQWYEDGKQFIKQHGLTCKSVPPIQFPLPLKPNSTQTSWFNTLISETTSSGSPRPNYVTPR